MQGTHVGGGTAPRIRELATEDWPLWRDARLRSLALDPGAFGSTAAEECALPDAAWRAWVAPGPDRQFWIAERDGAPVGMVRVQLAPDQLRAGLYSMWVAPEARRTGAGRALVGAAAAWCERSGAAEIRLDVASTQLAAIALYEAMGFLAAGDGGPMRPGSSVMRRRYRRPLRPWVMGVVNVTPDSFSDGGRYLAVDAAVAHGLALLRDGADILDVGGEATNPRAQPVSVDEELRRVLPVVQRLAAAGARVSIDTTKAAVARAAVAAGATIINDVSGGRFDPEMSEAIGDATYIVGHLRGGSLAEVFAAEAAPAPPLDWEAVADELAERIAALPAPARARVWVDPGLGFGKGAEPAANLALLLRAGAIGARLDRPVVIGASRKRFVRRAWSVDGDDLAALDAASVTASVDAAAAGANVLRVHNVALLRAALALYTKQ